MTTNIPVPSIVENAIGRMALDPRATFISGAVLDCKVIVDQEPKFGNAKAEFVAYVCADTATHRRIMELGAAYEGYRAGLGIDGYILGVNPEAITELALTPGEVQYVIGHEGYHRRRGDPWWLARVQRAGHVNGRPFLMQVAQLSMDAGVNAFLDAENAHAQKAEPNRRLPPFGHRPKVAFLDPDIEWSHTQSEAYCILYDKLKNEGKIKESGDGQGEGGGPGAVVKGELPEGFGADVYPAGGNSDGTPEGDPNHPANGKLSDAEIEEGLRNAQNAFAQDLARAVQAGKITGDAARELMEKLKPSYSLHDLIEQVIPSMLEGKGHEDYSRPNRRRVYEVINARARGMRVCLPPSQTSYVCGPVVAIVDVSGSMNRDDLAKAFGTVADVLDRYKPSALYMMTADTEETAFITIPSTEALREYEVRGGGGTDMGEALKEVWRKVEDGEIEQPALVIVATDGYTPWCGELPMKTVAIVTQDNLRDVPSWITPIKWQ